MRASGKKRGICLYSASLSKIMTFVPIFAGICSVTVLCGRRILTGDLKPSRTQDQVGFIKLPCARAPYLGSAAFWTLGDLMRSQNLL